MCFCLHTARRFRPRPGPDRAGQFAGAAGADHAARVQKQGNHAGNPEAAPPAGSRTGRARKSRSNDRAARPAAAQGRTRGPPGCPAGLAPPADGPARGSDADAEESPNAEPPLDAQL